MRTINASREMPCREAKRQRLDQSTIATEQPDSKYQWKQFGGSWSRKFDPVEETVHFMTVASPLLQWVITVGATVQNTALIGDVKTAWIALRNAYPVVGATITDTGLQYKVPDSEEELQKWVEETVICDRSGSSAQDLALSTVAPSGSRAAEIWFLPTTNEVFLMIRHEICDGVGSLILLNSFLELLNKGSVVEFAEFGREHTRLSTPITQIMKAEEPFTFQKKRANRMAEKYTRKRALSLRTEPQTASTTSKFQRTEYVFTKEETSNIIRACKENDITITHAATAAAAQAILEHSGKDSGPFATIYHVNMRDMLPEQYKRAIGNLFTTAFETIEISKSSNLLDLSEKMERIITSWKHKKNNVSYSNFLPEILIKTVIAAATEGTEFPAIVAPISLGVVEKYLTEPMIDFWFNLSTAGSGSCMYIYTAKERLRFVYCFDSAFHKLEGMQKFVKTTVGYFNEGLELV
ncbi:hypothetical protein H072_3758 [Dactylellina haptotyla CBS 200.50]|uniref:Condensation domain-containing protein n=1 Tax=Dactylellina haptotyla (strain CBS 200.50) TaxID=1284197 RepID=S8BS24_DACHA|nr:hypothetical protein H072_3758 [Dactylellina haptotyla CBS 200.50]